MSNEAEFSEGVAKENDCQLNLDQASKSQRELEEIKNKRNFAENSTGSAKTTVEKWFPWIFWLLFVFLTAALVVLFVVLWPGYQKGRPIATVEKMALAASVQVALGMVMGFTSVFMGMMMTWFGIVADFDFNGKAGGKGEVTLKSASPGLLFFLGGIILIGVSLHKTIEYREPYKVTRNRVPTEHEKGETNSNQVKPNPLPPFPPGEKR